MIIIDNYDSFTYNIVRYFVELGASPKVFKNDEISVEDLKLMDFNSLVISPGPGCPSEAGISMEVINEFFKTKKILGICLGHQCIAQFFGAKIVKDSAPFHGKVSEIILEKESELFKNIPKKFNVTRYHSLVVDSKTVRDPLIVTAKTENGIVMAAEHKNLPVFGVQFHPEAILTEYGYELLDNFLRV